MIRSKDHKFDLRLRLVRHARTHGIRAAARSFGCARNTVRTWLRRFERGGPSTLLERSRAPRHCPHKTSPVEEKRIVAARRKLPCAGPRRLKDLFGLAPSQGAIARILRARGLTRKRRTKRHKKNDLRAVKARYKAFERLQADTKPLYDIAAYWPQMRAHGLPRHQYTVRDVKSGALFVDYADELSTTYATLSTQRILTHLRAFGVPMDGLVLSTDNGSEYGGTERSERDRGYHMRVEQFGLTHRFLPPRMPNAHADVETVHALVEDELFDLERFGHRRAFFATVRTYQRWFNFARPNYSKGGKTPADILVEAGVDPWVLLLDPLDLDRHLRHLSHPPPARPRVGQDVPALPVSSPSNSAAMRLSALACRPGSSRARAGPAACGRRAHPIRPFCGTAPSRGAGRSAARTCGAA
jgi:transposase